MTKYLIVTFYVISSCIFAINAQQADSSYISTENLLIEPLFEEYHTNDTIVLALKNTSDNPVFYAISLEENIGRQWITIVNDIYKHSGDLHKARNIKTLTEGQQSIYTLTVSNLIKETSAPRGICRFKINAKKTPLERKGVKIYSTSFIILPESDRESDREN